MRRRVIITVGIVLAVLGAAGGAFAASTYNNYTNSKLAITPGAGTKAKPVSLGFSQILNAKAPPGHRAAPLVHLRVKIFGVKFDAGKLPVCTDHLILTKKENPLGGCPKGSLIGNGPVKSVLGPGNDPTGQGTACNPFLHVFNGGPKTQVFYFYIKRRTDCSGLTTGATAPYDGHISYSGGYAIIDRTLPADISTKVANQPGLYSSVINETVVFSKTVAGKKYMVGVGCKKGKRPWSITVTAHLYTGRNETQTINGSAKC